ncbi:MAG: hypothetical protein ACQEP1_05735 [Nanobdellota archaeon]
MRQTAHIVGIDEIKNSTYTKSEGEWDPNYIMIRGIKVSRVNVIGVIISNDENSFYVDDGSDNIMVRIFDDNIHIPELEMGDIVMVIGKPREYNDENYIVPEIVKKIKNEKWVEVRKKEIEKLRNEAPAEAPPEQQPKKEEVKEKAEEEPVKEGPKEEVVEEMAVGKNEHEDLFELIKKHDDGNGADIEKIVEESSKENTEEIINNLLNEGEIFEVKPGRVKILE